MPTTPASTTTTLITTANEPTVNYDTNTTLTYSTFTNTWYCCS